MPRMKQSAKRQRCCSLKGPKEYGTSLKPLGRVTFHCQSKRLVLSIYLENLSAWMQQCCTSFHRTEVGSLFKVVNLNIPEHGLHPTCRCKHQIVSPVQDAIPELHGDIAASEYTFL